MNKILKTCQTHFFFSFAMLEKLIADCPAQIWSVKAGGFVFWQQILHALTGAYFWMRKSGEAFAEPFADRRTFPELDNEPEGTVTRDEMLEYKDHVESICLRFFDGKEDDWLTRPAGAYDKITNLDVVFMQVRHIQYHVGHCNSIFRERNLPAVEWIDFEEE